MRITWGKRDEEGEILILVAENKEESKLFDSVFGNKVEKDGLIAQIQGEVRLSDGFGEHYLVLKRKQD